jgi:ribosomal protein S18 acetylase RimI-like enzyme
VTLPPGFRFRPVRDVDAVVVAALANEEAEALIGARVYSCEWLLHNWTAPSTDRENDVVVVEGPDGAVCGYLGVGADPPYTAVFAVGMVALSHHGRGLGAAILAESENRAGRFLELAGPDPRVVLRAETLVGEPRVSGLLEARGYREVRRFWLMRVDFEGEPAALVALSGIDVRTLRPDVDGEAVYEVDRDAFADAWGTGETTYEDFSHYYLAGPRFDPSLCLVAWAGDEAAGFCLAIDESEEDPSRGYVQGLGVRSAYRRRGIAEALLRRTFLELHARGKAGCDLHVDAESPTGATRLYERVGMAAHPRFATWEKELRPGRAS